MSFVAANTFMGIYWQRQDAYDLALHYFRRAAKLDPDNPAYLVEIGNLVALLGDLERGEAYYRQAIALSPNDLQYAREFLRFSILFNLNLRDKALPVARQLVISHPEDFAALDLMGELLFRLGDVLNAERFFLRALAQNREYDQAHLHLGNLYRSQGKYDQARFHYDRVLESSGNAQTIAHAQEMLDLYFSP